MSKERAEKFNELLYVPGIYLKIKWNELDVIDQNQFINKWNKFNNLISSNQNKSRNSYGILLLHIIVFMERNYDKINSIVRLFDYEKITKDEDIHYIDDDDTDMFNDESNFSVIDLIERIKKIPIEDIYMYLMETIQKFIPTWYGRNIIKINGNDIKFNYKSYIDIKLEKYDEKL